MYVYITSCAIENAIVEWIHKPLLILKLHCALQLIEYFRNLHNDVTWNNSKDMKNGNMVLDWWEMDWRSKYGKPDIVFT